MNASTRTRIGTWIATPALNLLEDGERSIRIEPKAMDVLVYLTSRPGEVVSVEEILREVWRGVIVTDASVYMAIKQLRRALAGSGEDTEYVETIPKRGYRLVAAVERLVDPGGSGPPEESLAAGPRLPALAESLPDPVPLYRRVALAPVPLAVFVVAVALVAGVVWVLRGPGGDDIVSAVPAEPRFSEMTVANFESFALSHDGQYIAFTTRTSPTESVLNLRRMSEPEAHVIPGAAGATGTPFWSHDSRHIAYAVVKPGDPAFLVMAAGFRLMRIARDGGPAQTLVEHVSVPPDGAWNADDVIVFDGGTGLERIAATTGGDHARVTELAPTEGAHVQPSFLPDGRRFLFTTAFGEPGVFVQSLDSGERTRILPHSGTAIYADGYLLFNRSGALFAQQFDLESLALQGEPTQIAEGLFTDPTGVYAAVSVSRTGDLAYVTRAMDDPTPDYAISQLVWYDRSGDRLETVGEPGVYRGMALSRDEKRIAVHRHDAPDEGDILLLDERGTFLRFTDGPRHEDSAVFSPDDSRILYAGGDYELYEKPSQGVGAEKPIVDGLRFSLPTDWPRDDTVLVTHTKMSAINADISAIRLGGDHGAVALAETAHDEIGGVLSPNGRFLAYSSDEFGRNEIYVVTYPERSRKWMVSTGGGEGPQWSKEGELFWFTTDGAVMAVTVDSADAENPLGSPQELFRANLMIGDHFISIGERPHVPFAVAADGERFLINERVSGDGAGFTPRTAKIVLVQDWTALVE